MMSIRKKIGAFFLASGLVFASFPATPVQAIEASVAIDITGTIPVIVVITLSSGSYAIDFETDPSASNQTIATESDASNNPGGYVVTVTSTQLAAGNCGTQTYPCLYSPTTTDQVDYTVNDTVGGSGTLSFDSGTGTATWRTVSGVQLTTVSDDVQLNWDTTGGLITAGSDYADTLTFTITTN